jgi:hypothetical protein
MARMFFAGWSSPVARQAHNLKVVSSNLAPATNQIFKTRQSDQPPNRAAFLCLKRDATAELAAYFARFMLSQR